MKQRESEKERQSLTGAATELCTAEREFFVDNSLARIHFIIVMIRWTGLAPWEIEFPFPGSHTSTFLAGLLKCLQPNANDAGKERNG
jgi:hypothetical protein